MDNSPPSAERPELGREMPVMKCWMRDEVKAGAVAGLGSGLVVGLVTALFSLMVPANGGVWRVSVLAGMVPLPSEMAVVVALGYGIAVGGLYGWLHRGEWLEKGAALVRGGLYGVGWGIVAVLVVVPAMQGLIPFSYGALAIAGRVYLVAMIGHAVYGMLVGLGFSMMTYRVVGRPEPVVVRSPSSRKAA
jgi:hypothetical protein